MNNASRTRRLIAASLVLLGLAANVSQAQTVVSVNGTTCANATVTLGAGTININTASCGAAAAPTITSISPASAIRNAPVTINGTGFTGTTSVTIGGATANFSVVGANQITTNVPTAATLGNGSVVVTVGLAVASAVFTVDTPPAASAPAISSVSPVTGAPGTIVTLNGTGFTGVTSVTIGGAPANFSINSATLITTSVPATATVGSANGVVVTVPSFTPATIGFTVEIGGGDVSIDGYTIPNPSKRPTSVAAAQPHPGLLNGAGSEILAYAMPPTRCLTTPALTRSWQHNINFAEYKIGAVDNFVMNPGESLSYKFTVGNSDESGGFNYGESAQSGGNIRPAFMTVTSAPCEVVVAQQGHVSSTTR